jgi:4-amino-4-deoxy-L-arabinose transferase-like glycosyltransferase
MQYVKKHWSLLALTIIVFVAAVLRLYYLGSLPNGLYVDEVAIAVDAASIAQTGKDMHGGPWLTAIFPSYGDYKLPVYIWFAAVSEKVFGQTDFAVRLPSAVAGVLTVVLVYALALELFEHESHKKFIAVCSATAVAIMPWSILFSRTGFEAHVGQMLLLVSTYAALRAKNASWMYLVSAVVGAFAVHSYYSVRFVFPVVFVLIFLLQMKKKIWSRGVGWMVGGLVIFFLLLLPMMRSPFYAQMQFIRLSTDNVLTTTAFIEKANHLRALAGDSMISHLVFHRTVFMMEELARHYADFLNPSYLFLTGDTNLRHSTWQAGIFLLGMAPLFLLGLIALVQKHKKVAIFFLVWYVAAILPAAVPYDTPHALRSLNALGLMALIIGLGGSELVLLANKSMSRKLVGVATVVLITLNFFSFWHDYTKLYPDRSEAAWALSRKTLGEFLQKKKTAYQTISIIADDRLFLWVAWYGKFDIQTVQAAPSAHFVKQSFGNIHFTSVGRVSEKEIMATHGQKGMVIGHDNELSHFENSPIVTAPSESFSYVETK